VGVIYRPRAKIYNNDNYRDTITTATITIIKTIIIVINKIGL